MWVKLTTYNIDKPALKERMAVNSDKIVEVFEASQRDLHDTDIVHKFSVVSLGGDRMVRVHETFDQIVGMLPNE